MTRQQIILMSGLYVVALGIAIYFTRATARRVMGALTGAAAAGCFGLGAILLGEALGVWRVFLSSAPGVSVLFYLGFAISLSPIYLITWRLARRFGWRGLAVFLGAVAVIGPPRDYLIAATFPEWMVFAPGVVPIVADAATYVGIMALGHAVMRIIAGDARGDRLSRRPQEAT